MPPRRRCPVCRSKHWHKEPSSGLITCSEGHVLQNYRNETTEVTELGPHAVRKRTLKSGRKKKERQSKADAKLYHGERARYHYFQCLQLILRMQITSLTRLWQLPHNEFESVCRDIWALNLSLLPNPPVAEPLLHNNLQDGLAVGRVLTGTLARDEHRSGNEGDSESDGVQSDRSRQSGLSPASSSSTLDFDSDDSDDSEHDSELEDLMRENSETPSSEDDDLEESRKHRTSVPVPPTRPTFYQYDVPASTVAVLVVACWTLRLPVVYMDFVRLIEAYDLPYLDVIALRLIPENMMRHLRKHTVQTLSPHNAPTPTHLHRLSSRLARLMYSSYEIYTPEMNAAPVLWKAVRSLQGTPTIYVLTKELARVVSIPLMLHRSLAPALTRVQHRDPAFHKHDGAIPEVALVAAVIVVMKMVYGLDGKPRRPSCKTDPACALPNLAELLSAIRVREVESSASEYVHISPSGVGKERSALDMDEQWTDSYLQFCEKALLPRGDRMPSRNVMTDQFPVCPDVPLESAGDSREHISWPTLAANRLDQVGLRPGEQYSVYDTQDLLGSLPDDLEYVNSRAARWAGVDEEYVAGVVERFERRVVRWWDGLRKRERGEQGVYTSE